MSIADRKAKEKGDLMALILKGAKDVFVENGFDKTTIRNIADRIDYSVGTVYVYFKDKNAILLELQSIGFRQLLEQMGTLTMVTDPMERLIALGKQYLQFANENPELYELMFTIKAPMDLLNKMEKEWWEGKATFNGLKQTVSECLSQGHFKGHTLEPLSYIMWSVVHGMCSISLNGRVKAVDFHDTENLLDKSYEEFVMMLKKM